MDCSIVDKKPTVTQGQAAGPCVMIIFGASGDLAKRKLIPAIRNLSKHALLPEEFAIVGLARAPLGDAAYREKVTEDLKRYATVDIDDTFIQWFQKRLYYISGDLHDPSTYEKLKQRLLDIDKEHSTAGNYFYYLATAPSFFSEVIKQLGACGLTDNGENRWRRVVIEKPFGRDLESAKKLNREILTVLDESQIYRIDHYLGKETVQNILAFRFANGIFEPVWNRRYIDHVQISVSEQIGVEGRGAYYDMAGALRDMVPNHIIQLITLIAMEPPISFDANAVRDEQAKILASIQPMSPEEVLKYCVRGQYGKAMINGETTPGYREEANVPEDSMTETFVALKLFLENWRWAEVPFYLRTGKRMATRVSEVAIQFKRAPFVLFRQTPVDHLAPNRLVIRIQPDEGISLSFSAKTPGPLMGLGTVNMNFQYQDYFGSEPSAGYERLLYDCMMGDATLFQRADITEAGWSVVAPALDVWSALPPREFPNYAAGSWGPKEADDLLTRDGRRWIVCE